MPEHCAVCGAALQPRERVERSPAGDMPYHVDFAACIAYTLRRELGGDWMQVQRGRDVIEVIARAGERE